MKKQILLLYLIFIFIILYGCNTQTKQKSNEDITTSEVKINNTFHVNENSSQIDQVNDKIITTNEVNINSIYHFNEDGYLTNFYASLNILVERDKNYIVYSNESREEEHFSVFDNKGNLLDDGYSPYGVEFNKIGNYLEMEYYVNAGELNKICYYNLELGKVSRFFTNSLGSSNELVAYYSKNADNEIVLVVQNIFDENVYYKEIKRNFSEKVFKDIYPVKFLNNNSSIEFSYWILPNNELKTEIINL